MSNPYFGKFLIWSVPPKLQMAHRRVHSAYDTYKERDKEIERLRKLGDNRTYIKQDPADDERTDARRTF